MFMFGRVNSPRYAVLSPMARPCETEFTSIQLVFVCSLMLTLLATVFFHLEHEIADEGFHGPQIYSFYSGDYTQHEALTVLPIYHAVVAGVQKALGEYSILLSRVVTLLLSALSLPVFFNLCRSLHSKQADTRLLLFLSCPMILPFFFLVYSDIPALLMVLLMVYQTVKGRYIWAGVFSVGAVLVRQPNLVWVAFCSCYIVIQHYQEIAPKSLKSYLDSWWSLFCRLLPFGTAFCLIVALFIVSGGVVQGDMAQHEISFNLSNLYYFLLLSFFFLLPYNIDNTTAIANLVKTRRWVWGLIPVFFLVYMATYNNHHQYNSYGLSFYLRNVILHYTVEFPLAKALAFIPMVWMALSFVVFLKQSRKPMYLALVYFFGCLSFIPLPLVEQRYYIVAYVLFLAFKPTGKSAALDYWTLFLYLPANGALLFLISQSRLFL